MDERGKAWAELTAAAEAFAMARNWQPYGQHFSDACQRLERAALAYAAVRLLVADGV